MDFSEEQSHRGTFTHPGRGKLGEGQLIFGGGRAISATLSLESLRLGLDKAPLDFVHFTSDDNRVFTLFKCTVHAMFMQAQFIVVGHIHTGTFSRFDVRYSEVSEWFFEWQRLDGRIGDKLIWINRPTEIAVEVGGKQRFKLSSLFVGSTDRVGEDTTVHEHVEFSFDALSDGFTIDQLRVRSVELGALLSLITGFAVTVIGVEVMAEPGRLLPAYFGTFKRVPRSDDGDITNRCFFQKHWLDKQWASILERYFREVDREDTWVRLAGMQRYEGFWEFRMFGYVSLLDEFAARRASTPAGGMLPPSQRKRTKLAKRLTRITPEIGRDRIAQIMRDVTEVFAHRDPTFEDQFVSAMNATDVRIRQVISLTDAHFEWIKTVRDRIAHGKSPGLKGDDFTQMSVVVNKVSLLMTYWTLSDLGVLPDEFLTALSRTASPIGLGASIDRKALARAAKTAQFFLVSAEQFEQLAGLKALRDSVCLIEGPEGELEFSQQYAAKRRAYFEDRTATRTAVTPWATIFGVEEGAVRYVPVVYIESGERTLELDSVALFDRSRLGI